MFNNRYYPLSKFFLMPLISPNVLWILLAIPVQNTSWPQGIVSTWLEEQILATVNQMTYLHQTVTTMNLLIHQKLIPIQIYTEDAFMVTHGCVQRRKDQIIVYHVQVKIKLACSLYLLISAQFWPSKQVQRVWGHMLRILGLLVGYITVFKELPNLSECSKMQEE